MDYITLKEWLLSRVNHIYINGPEYDLLSTLLKQHPSCHDWKLNKPYAFKIIKKKYIQLHVSFFSDKKYRIVSWVSCCNQKIRKINPLTSAMRQAIKRQITIYKNNHNNKQCVLCQSLENIEVDHVVKFVTIKNNFIINHTPPTLFDTHPKRGYYMFKKSDVKWKKEWQKYHLNMASYRYLCSTCNKK